MPPDGGCGLGAIRFRAHGRMTAVQVPVPHNPIVHTVGRGLPAGEFRRLLRRVRFPTRLRCFPFGAASLLPSARFDVAVSTFARVSCGGVVGGTAVSRRSTRRAHFWRAEPRSGIRWFSRSTSARAILAVGTGFGVFAGARTASTIASFNQHYPGTAPKPR